MRPRPLRPGRPSLRSPPSPRRTDAVSRGAERVDVGRALRGADRRHGGGQVDRPGGARAAGCGGAFVRRGRPRALRRRAAARGASLDAGAPRWRRMAWSTARRSRSARSRADDRAWLEGLLWPLVGARVAAWLEEVRPASAPPGPPTAGGRGGGPAAVRGGPRRALRRDDRGRLRGARCAERGPPSAGTSWRTSVLRASSRRMRRRDGRRSSCATTAPRRISSADCRRFLTSFEDEPANAWYARDDRSRGLVAGADRRGS